MSVKGITVGVGYRNDMAIIELLKGTKATT
jgi:hypothetical protein